MRRQLRAHLSRWHSAGRRRTNRLAGRPPGRPVHRAGVRLDVESTQSAAGPEGTRWCSCRVEMRVDDTTAASQSRAAFELNILELCVSKRWSTLSALPILYNCEGCDSGRQSRAELAFEPNILCISKEMANPVCSADMPSRQSRAAAQHYHVHTGAADQDTHMRPGAWPSVVSRGKEVRLCTY